MDCAFHVTIFRGVILLFGVLIIINSGNKRWDVSHEFRFELRPLVHEHIHKLHGLLHVIGRVCGLWYAFSGRGFGVLTAVIFNRLCEIHV